MAVLRKTKSIKLLLDVFDQTNDAISVVELVDRFKNQMDKSTVYRTLDRLEGQGILHSFVGRDSAKRYARWDNKNIDTTDIKIHPHFECRYCGITSCLPIQVSIPSVSNFIIESAEQLLVGKCSNCI